MYVSGLDYRSIYYTFLDKNKGVKMKLWLLENKYENLEKAALILAAIWILWPIVAGIILRLTCGD